MKAKKGKAWNATEYEGQRAFGVVLPYVTRAWLSSCTPEWWREGQ